jgi:uncharacterized damage-inducible protein DinB
MPIIDLLLPEFDQEMANTRKMLERVPEDKLGWKPHPKSFDLAALASHIATMVSWTTDTLAKDSFDFAPPGQPAYVPPKASSTAELLAWFDKAVPEARALLAAASDEKLMQPWSLLAHGQTIFTMSRIVCIRSFVMNHTIHHRAQLGVYLRLLDVPVPGMYGQSADDPKLF